VSTGGADTPDDPPRAKGRAIRRSDAEINDLARIGPDDEGPAKDLWHRDAPRKFKGLIDADADDEE
jgi:hypothetical protein